MSVVYSVVAKGSDGDPCLLTEEALEALRAERGERECHLCRREAPCECMTLVQDGGPYFEPVTCTWGWSWHPERCMCTCGRCMAP